MRSRQLPIVRSSRRVLLGMLVVAAVWIALPRPVMPSQECLTASGEAAVAACRRALRDSPGDLDLRLALSDAYMSVRRYEDAVVVLREAFEFAPGDDTIKRQLALAESYLEEQRWIEKREQSAGALQATGKTAAEIRLSIIRCSKLQGENAIAACNEGLQLSPGNADLLIGRGNAWLGMDQPGNAAADYQAALAAVPGNREAGKQLRLAAAKRKVKVAQCLQGAGQRALDACNAALLKGADDEFSVRKQQARLLHGLERDEEALRAYQAAARLNPADPDVTRALAVWSPESRPAAPSPPDATLPEPKPKPATPSAVARKQPAVVTPVTVKPEVAIAPQPKAKPKETVPTPNPIPQRIAPPTAAARDVNQDDRLAPSAAAPATVPVPPRRFSNRPSRPGITH